MSKKYRERVAKSSGIGSSKVFESDFGKRTLLKYGWREGEGLGRRGDGRTECVQSVRREEKRGLGAEKRKAEDDWDNWWSDCFNNVAKRLSASAEGGAEGNMSEGRALKRAGEESDSESSDAGETGGRITAIKSAGAMGGKLRRVLRQEAPKQPPA